jgi:hypothetical protein
MNQNPKLSSVVDLKTGVEIERGIPLPPHGNKYPWTRMEVNESVWYPIPDNISPARFQSKLLGLAQRSGGSRSRKWASRQWEKKGVKGIRIWRTH